MTSATRYSLQAIERTPIYIFDTTYRARCLSCHRDVTPQRIVTKFLDMPLDYCPRCHSIFQRFATRVAAPDA